jgi:V/A-type H+-transporting ATPase subunit E
MEAKLEHLIEKIKKDGIAQAEQEAQQIKADATSQAEKIITEAEKKAETITKQARQESDKFRKNAEVAISQAGRDLILTLRQKIKNLFDFFMQQEVSDSINSQYLRDLILKVIEKWQPQQEELVLEVSSQDKEKLQQILVKDLKDRLQNGIEIKINPEIEKGFFISTKEGQMYYDFSDQSIAGSLEKFLSSQLQSLINKGLEQEGNRKEKNKNSQDDK